MANQQLVTVVGATGAQGSAIVRALLETKKYKIRGLTRDANGPKAQALKDLGDNVEVVTCNINNKDDVQRAFQGSWAIFGLTDFWAQPDKPEVEMQQGMLMADVVASLQTPYYVFSTLENVEALSGGKYNVPHFTQKAQLRDYIKTKHPTLKAIYVEPGFYMQNWGTFFKTQKLDDGTVLFAMPADQQTKLNLVDINDMGPIVRAILNDPDKFVGQDICICGEALTLEEIAKVFTKVTGIPATSKTITDEEFRSAAKETPKFVQDEILDMCKWFEEYGYYGKDKDWTNGQKLTKLKTFEDWLKTSGWKGD